MNGFAEMSLIDKVRVYKQFDDARHTDLEEMASEYEAMKAKIRELQTDLDEERKTRRNYKYQADAIEQSISRKFAVMLIDGDGYHFCRRFYNTEAGDQAASSLQKDVQSYLKDQYGSNDVDLVVNVFFNKQVPAIALRDADIISRPGQLDEFFWAFTSSNSLFQVTDCGPGKERADTKLRDTYKFWLSNAQCQHIFLACCHDNGYVAELDKYRHHSNAAAKTILVRHGNTANQFYNLNLPFARFESTFEMDPIHTTGRRESQQPIVPIHAPATYTPLPYTAKTTRIPSPQTSNDGDAGPAAWSTITASRVARTNTMNTSVEPEKAAPMYDVKSGISVNRYGQRIDRRIPPPSIAELDRFGERIAQQKLCNSYHLSTAGCFAYNCQFSHGKIDEAMLNTLKYKARSIPCSVGSTCRKGDCFYGHHCPWGNDSCSNGKCAFRARGLHDIRDFQVDKVVPAIQ